MALHPGKPAHTRVYKVMAYTVMAYVVMANIVMANIVMAYTVMALRPGKPAHTHSLPPSLTRTLAHVSVHPHVQTASGVYSCGAYSYGLYIVIVIYMCPSARPKP